VTMRRFLLALALLPALAACGEDDPTGTPAGPAWDLAFAGEVAGTMVLMRTRGAARTVTRIGLGYPGIGVVANAAGTRLAFTTLGTSAEPPRLAYVDDADEEPRLFAGWTESYEREPKWSPGGDHFGSRS